MKGTKRKLSIFLKNCVLRKQKEEKPKKLEKIKPVF